MAKRFCNESSISEVLQQFIQVNKLESGMDKIDVEQAWKSLMGNGVNSYTQEVVLKGSTLYVKLTSAVLREELSYGKDKIIKMLNEELRKDVQAAEDDPRQQAQDKQEAKQTWHGFDLQKWLVFP